MTERMDDRALRLKTLGNAVCPPQTYPIFRYIAMIENGTCGDFCPYPEMVRAALRSEVQNTR